LRLLSLGILTVLLALSWVDGCRAPNPALFPSYDVLKPGPTVKIVGFDPAGNVVVSPDFMLWVYDLKSEIARLRKNQK
jgi:hypothetical protein